MARSYNYYKQTQQQRSDALNKKFNLQEASKEKIGIKTTWEMLSPTYNTQPAPQSAGKDRHRATTIAYSKEAQTLVIKMRDGQWIGYDNTPVEIWNSLKVASSTHDFIEAGNLGAWYNFNPSDMPEDVRVLFNS
jgi:hypothetical protein